VSKEKKEVVQKLKQDQFSLDGKTYTMPCVIEDLAEELYHGPELVAQEFIGHSGLAKLVMKTPAHFKEYIKNDNSGRTPAMIFGSAAHLMMLDKKWAEKIAVCQITKRDGSIMDYWSAAAQTWRDKAIESKKVEAAILKKEMIQLTEMKNELLKHPTARGLLNNGKSEVSIFFLHPRYEGVKCKIRVDYLIHDSLLAFVDYKTTQDASHVQFAKSAYDFGYDIQAELYREGGQIIYGKKPNFFFIAQEKEPPYAVNVFLGNEWGEDLKENEYIYAPDSTFTELGRKRTNKALEIYWKCLLNPQLFNAAYGANFEILYPPHWALNEWDIRE